MQADETASLRVLGVVMRPVHDRQSPGVVNHLSGDLDRIAALHRTARRDGDVIDDFERPGAACDVERLVQRVRARTVEEARRRGNGPSEIDPRRRPTGVGGSQIHRTCLHANPPELQGCAAR